MRRGSARHHPAPTITIVSMRLMTSHGTGRQLAARGPVRVGASFFVRASMSRADIRTPFSAVHPARRRQSPSGAPKRVRFFRVRPDRTPRIVLPRAPRG